MLQTMLFMFEPLTSDMTLNIKDLTYFVNNRQERIEKRYSIMYSLALYVLAELKDTFKRLNA